MGQQRGREKNEVRCLSTECQAGIRQTRTPPCTRPEGQELLFLLSPTHDVTSLACQGCLPPAPIRLAKC